MAKKRNLLPSLIIVLAVILAILAAVAIFLRITEPSVEPTDPTVTDAPTDPPTDPPTEPPTDPPVVKTSTATIGAMGDLLMHLPVVNGYYSSNGTYDFTPAFRYLTPILSRLDYAAINLETTLCGTDNGYAYQGYPNFNCPDAIVDGVKNAGFDMILTANNHTYDTGHVGFHRTQQVIRDKELDYIGTRMSQEEKNYIIKELNGIRIGMICYTYNTGVNGAGQVDLNWGNLMDVEDSPLINSYNYHQLDTFYQKLSGEMETMKAEGAEAIVVYMHWGEQEYHLTPNTHQATIAQKLCDMGVDVIVGGHPHVVQPVELLTSTTDETQKTLCIYSLGNAISNQRLGNVSCETAHTEDGALFTVTFAKYSDGTVVVESTEVIPLWVNMYWGTNGRRQYDILPLDSAQETWQSAMSLSTDRYQQCLASLDRTKALVEAGSQAANDYFKTNQEQVEAAIGVKKA